MRALFWSVRRRPPRRGDRQWVHTAAEALLAVGLVATALGVSRLAGAPLPYPVSAAVQGMLPLVAAVKPAGPVVQARVELFSNAQGRAVLVVAGDQADLIDGGPTELGEAVLARLRALHITRLQRVVLTSGGTSSAAGLVPLLQAVAVGRILDLVPGNRCPAHDAVLAAARARGTPVQPVQRGTTVHLGPVQMNILWPATDLAQPGSLPAGAGMVRLVDGQVRILLAATVNPQELDSLRRLGPDLRAQVLEVPAPVVPASLPQEFLRAVAPRVAVLEPRLGVAPDPAVVQRLAAAHAVTVETTQAAGLQIATDGRGLTLSFDPGLPTTAPSAPEEAAEPAPASPAAGGACA